MVDALQKRPVAWRCRDYADGWIIFQDEQAAWKYQEATDALMQGLYVRDGDALPLPPSPVKESRDAVNSCGCVLCDFDLIPRNFRNHVTRAGTVYPCTNREVQKLLDKSTPHQGGGGRE